MGKKKKKLIQIGETYLNRRDQQCKVLSRGKGKSKGLFIVAVLDQPSQAEKDGCFHYAASPDELTLPRSPKQIIKNIKEDLEQLCKQAKQQRGEVEFQMSSLKKCKEVIKPKYGPYRLNPKRFGQMVPEKVSKKFRKAAREIGRQVSIQFKNLKIQRATARNTTSEILDMAERVIQSLTLMGVSLEDMPRQITDMENRGKLYNYERRREIALYNETLGKDLTQSQKPTEKSRGQQKGAKIMASKKSDKEQIESLLRKLEKSNDPQEKRETRAELRKLGHRGGLGKGAGRPKKAAKKTTKKKKKAKRSAA